MSDEIEPLGGETVFEGKTFSVRVERFRHADGEVVEREIVRRQDAAAVVAYDDEHVWLVRQPREAITMLTLELPAGKLDVEGESPLQTAQRELGEEIGRAADDWHEVISYFPSSGYTDERVYIFAATGLYEVDAESDPGERIEIVQWPLDDLDTAIRECQDGKTIIGLQWLESKKAVSSSGRLAPPAQRVVRRPPDDVT
jgi:8-oxo-dGTP pyrophosphatase MutT (NUDIX family)